MWISRERFGAGAALAWAAQPGTLAGLAVLVVNDHLLKRAWPGLVTGKLSDFAGMLVAPPLLALLFSWLRGRSSDRQAVAALVLTAVGFVCAKTSVQGAELASGLWSLSGVPTRMLADPTDLIALPALALAWCCRRRARTRPVAEPGARRVRALVLVPLLVAGTVATSPVDPPSSQLATSGGRVYVTEGVISRAAVPARLLAVAATDDGGRTWQRLERGAVVLPRSDAAGTSACVPDDPQHCFRVAGEPAPQVQETTDGGSTWGTAWQLSPGRRYYLSRAEGAGLFAGDASFRVPEALLVQQVPGGFAVLVANGADGLLLRDAGGHWTRPDLPFTPKPAGLTGIGNVLWPEIVLSLTWACVCALAARRTLQRVSAARGSPLEMLGYGLVLLPLAMLEGWVATSGYVPLLSLPLAFLLLLGMIVLIGVTEPDERRPADFRGALSIPLAFLVFLGLTLGPFLGWAEGFPDSFVAAGWLALLGAVLSLVGSIRLGVLLSRRPTKAG